MSPDLSRLACVVSGSLPADTWTRLDRGDNPESDFTCLRSLGATLFTRDSAPSARGPIRAVLKGRFTPAHAVAEQADRFDAILCVAEDIGVPVSVSLRLHGKRTPLLVGIHGHYLRNRKFAAWARFVRNDPGVRFLALSEAIRARLVSDIGLPDWQCRTLCVPVDCGFFTPSDSPETAPPMILSAGAAQRDYETLAAIMPDVPARFRIASGSSWIAEAARIDLPANCDMGSAGSMRGLRDLYAAATMVVLPLQDMFHASGYAVAMEAMAMGKPLIVTQTAARADFFVDGKTCLLVPPQDGGALKAAILRLLADRDLRQRLGRAARDCMTAAHGLEAYAERIAGIVRDCRQPAGPRRAAG